MMTIMADETRTQDQRISPDQPRSASKIQTETRAALAKLSRSLADLVANVPGDIRRPVHLQQKLGIHYNVSWQVFQIIKADDPLSACHHVPSAVLMRQLTAAAAKVGVPSKITASVDHAVDGFNRIVAAYSDGRPAFDAMLAALSGGDPDEVVSIQNRRKAYRSESPLWGVQVEVVLGQLYVRFSEDNNEQAFVSVNHKLRRLREDLMPILSGFHMQDGTDVFPPGSVVPLETQAMAAHGAPLLPDFCTQPIPPLISIPTSTGWTFFSPASNKLGRKGDVTMTFGVTGKTGLTPEDATRQSLGFQITKPTELAILELFIHRPSFGTISTEFHATAVNPGGAILPEAFQRARRFRMHEQVEQLGPVAQMRPLTKIPRYAKMVDHVFDKLQWNPAEFDCCRVQVEYPILHTDLRLTVVSDQNKSRQS